MDINVIGGSGFLGSRLITRLLNSPCAKLTIIDKSPSYAHPKLVELCDVRNIDNLRQSICQNSIIINLAAEHRDNVRPLSLYDDVNVNGAINICKVANEKDVRIIIFTSSVAVYGFAPIGTNECGVIDPFNDYGRTKYEAENIYKLWQQEAPNLRTLVIIRPTVIFGERNRGNVYNLLRQIASGIFMFVGDGKNRKSLAYVENVAAFIEFSITLKPGIHLYNYIDKPDYSMNDLVAKVNNSLGRNNKITFRIPYLVGILIGKCFDFLESILNKNFAISSIRVKKFCSNSVYDTMYQNTGFSPPVPLDVALHKTVMYEFVESHNSNEVFYTE